MREGQINIAPATREDDTKEYHINSDNAVTNPANSKTSRGFSDVQSVASDMKIKLSKKNKKTKEVEIVDVAELDLMRGLRNGFAAKSKQESVADTSDLFCNI